MNKQLAILAATLSLTACGKAPEMFIDRCTEHHVETRMILSKLPASRGDIEIDGLVYTPKLVKFCIDSKRVKNPEYILWEQNKLTIFKITN